EHLVRPRNLPRFAKQLLRPGGHLIISTPYHGYLKNLLLALTDKWDAHLNPFWDGGHIKFWSRKTLSQLLNEAGFRVVRFIGGGIGTRSGSGTRCKSSAPTLGKRPTLNAERPTFNTEQRCARIIAPRSLQW